MEGWIKEYHTGWYPEGTATPHHQEAIKKKMLYGWCVQALRYLASKLWRAQLPVQNPSAIRHVLQPFSYLVAPESCISAYMQSTVIRHTYFYSSSVCSSRCGTSPAAFTTQANNLAIRNNWKSWLNELKPSTLWGLLALPWFNIEKLFKVKMAHQTWDFSGLKLAFSLQAKS